MQTFTFDELDARGQEAAIALNSKEILDCLKLNPSSDELVFSILFRLSWRFTEHGERIA